MNTPQKVMTVVGLVGVILLAAFIGTAMFTWAKINRRIVSDDDA